MKLPAERVSQLRPFYQGRTVCVTGGAGFIGGHLCDALASLGARVRVIDDLSNSTLEHLAGLMELEPDRVRFIQGSILDDDALRDAVRGARTIFHLAAIGSVPRSIEQPQRTWSVNVTGTLRVLEAARATRGSEAPVERVVFASSSSVYGDAPTLPREESQRPEPRSPYAAAKLAGEHLMRVWTACYGISTASLRYFNVFGARQAADTPYAAVVAAFTKRLLAGEAPTLFGDGSQSRDMTPVASAVLATLLAGSTKTPLAGEPINVGTGSRVTMADLASTLARITNQPHLQPIPGPPRAGDVLHSIADIARARALLGYEPVGTREEALADAVAWMRQAYARA